MNLKTKLAAALLQLRDCELDAGPYPLISYDEAKLMTVDQIVARFEFHHHKPRAEDGGDHPSNITPMLKERHRELTARHDIPRIAKNKRVRRKQEAHEERMRSK